MFVVALIASAVVADEDVKKTEKRGIYSGLGYGYNTGLYSPGLYGGGYGSHLGGYSSPLYSGYSSVSVHPSYAYTSGYPYAYKSYGGLGSGYASPYVGGYGGLGYGGIGGAYGGYVGSPYYGGLIH